MNAKKNFKGSSEVKKNYIFVISAKNPISWKSKIFSFRKFLFTWFFFSFSFVTLLPHRAENIERHVPDPQCTRTPNLNLITAIEIELGETNTYNRTIPPPPAPKKKSRFFFDHNYDHYYMNICWKFHEDIFSTFRVMIKYNRLKSVTDILTDILTHWLTDWLTSMLKLPIHSAERRRSFFRGINAPPTISVVCYHAGFIKCNLCIKLKKLNDFLLLVKILAKLSNSFFG